MACCFCTQLGMACLREMLKISQNVLRSPQILTFCLRKVLRVCAWGWGDFFQLSFTHVSASDWLLLQLCLAQFYKPWRFKGGFGLWNQARIGSDTEENNNIKQMPILKHTCNSHIRLYSSSLCQSKVFQKDCPHAHTIVLWFRIWLF